MGKVVSRVKGEARVSTPASERARERERDSARGRERECMNELDGAE